MFTKSMILFALIALVVLSHAAVSKPRDSQNEIENQELVRVGPKNILQDILAQIGHLTKDNREEIEADEQSRYFGEILDEYRRKFGFPRMEPRQPYTL